MSLRKCHVRIDKHLEARARGLLDKHLRTCNLAATRSNKFNHDTCIYVHDLQTTIMTITHSKSNHWLVYQYLFYRLQYSTLIENVIHVDIYKVLWRLLTAHNWQK